MKSSIELEGTGTDGLRDQSLLDVSLGSLLPARGPTDPRSVWSVDGSASGAEADFWRLSGSVLGAFAAWPQ